MAAYLNFKDRFDGGGAGQSGRSFQGGGLISQLGNMLFKPNGYNDQPMAPVQNMRPEVRPVATVQTQPQPQARVSTGGYVPSPMAALRPQARPADVAVIGNGPTSRPNNNPAQRSSAYKAPPPVDTMPLTDLRMLLNQLSDQYQSQLISPEQRARMQYANENALPSPY